MMYNEILAKKVIKFITPSIVLSSSSSINVHDYQKRQTLWQLLKSTMETIEIPLIRQFEKNPTGHDLNQATINLLCLKFREDRNLLRQIELFLDKQEDIEYVEKGNSRSDIRQASISRYSMKRISSYAVKNSFRTEWKRRRLQL